MVLRPMWFKRFKKHFGPPPKTHRASSLGSFLEVVGLQLSDYNNLLYNLEKKLPNALYIATGTSFLLSLFRRIDKHFKYFLIIGF